MSLYIDELRKHKVLKNEETVELIREYQKTRDIEVRNRIIEGNLGLVLKCVGKYSEDIFQESMLGLLKAIEKFDPDRGIRFSTYAWYWIERCKIEGKVKYQSNLCKIPKYKLGKHKENLVDIYYNKYRNSVYEIFNSNIESEEVRLSILEVLNPVEYHIILKRFYTSETLQMIGDKLDITKERVRQIEVKALKKLREQWCD